MHLVYGRSDADSPEPLIAVVEAEDEAGAIESSLASSASAVQVRWETHEVVGRVADLLHIVLLDAGSREDGGESADPIGLGVFADKGAAEADAKRRRETGEGPDVVVRSLPLGWRRPGWPSAEEGTGDRC
ncbi:hypothetical protein [Nocardioides sp.]|uniref:hypothetical protein n=1 Tax=Nocardioides sp. TaxID=35761 RepID=UPI0035193ED9